MNDAITTTTPGSSKSRFSLKRRHFYLLGSSVAIAVYVTYLADYASREATIIGMAILGTLTMVIALAAFFRAYSKD
jgi:hypothetical protein